MDKTSVFNWEAGTGHRMSGRSRESSGSWATTRPRRSPASGNDSEQPDAGSGFPMLTLLGDWGVDPGTVLNWERGRLQPTRHLLERIGRVVSR